MARKLINMRYVKDILRLKHQNQLSVREIAGSCGLPTSTVGDYLQRAASRRAELAFARRALRCRVGGTAPQAG